MKIFWRTLATSHLPPFRNFIVKSWIGFDTWMASFEVNPWSTFKAVNVCKTESLWELRLCHFPGGCWELWWRFALPSVWERFPWAKPALEVGPTYASPYRGKTVSVSLLLSPSKPKKQLAYSHSGQAWRVVIISWSDLPIQLTAFLTLLN